VLPRQKDRFNRGCLLSKYRGVMESRTNGSSSPIQQARPTAVPASFPVYVTPTITIVLIHLLLALMRLWNYTVSPTAPPLAARHHAMGQNDRENTTA
jgi:hypothetical protein